MSPEHLGRDAIPTHLVDSGAGGYSVDNTYSDAVSPRVRPYHALAQRHMHQRTGARRLELITLTSLYVCNSHNKISLRLDIKGL